MFEAAPQILELTATLYGVGAAATSLLQARQMLKSRTSRDVSAGFFGAYAGGYAIWLLYGLSIQSLPLVLVDSLGLLFAGFTLAVALSLRGSLLRPSTWRSCEAHS